MAQSVKHLTLGIGSGPDLAVVRSSPELGFLLSMEPAWDSLSPSLSLCPPAVHACVLTLCQNKYINLKK